MSKEFVEAGHFYSVIPNVPKDYNNNDIKFCDIDFNDAEHECIMNELNEYLSLFEETFCIPNNSDIQKNIIKRQNEFRYTLMNNAFGWMDGRVLHYFLQKNKPKKIIEIGSGNSTLMMHNTNEMFDLNIEITCIEPYPSDFLRNMAKNKKIILIEDKLENIDVEKFKELQKNDILFIDSSHVLKLDSDVMRYFTKIFPILNRNVLIHIHDIFFPYDYPTSWLKGGRFWNEQYALYIFLQYNTRFKIKFCNSYITFKYKDRLQEMQKNYYEVKNNIAKVFGGGSIWLSVE